jgi:hypothetical protein
MQANYFEKFQAEMARVLPTRSTREKVAFAALDVHEQAWRFLNWQSRLVHPHARQVNIADGFDSLPAVQANLPEIAALLGRISRGDDVGAHLSRDVMQGYCVHPPGRKHGPDFDLLLNEWGIHHLHIGQTKGKQVLYAIFGCGVAFALAVAPHGAWTSRSLIEVTVRSWPKQRLFIPLNVFPGRDYTEDEHKGLRKAGVTTTAVIDSRPWFSGVTCGISTALVSVRISTETGHLMRRLQNVTEQPDHLYRQLQAEAARKGVDWPSNPDIGIRWLSGPDRYCFGFVEETCGAALLINVA